MKTIYKVLIVLFVVNLASCKKDLLNKTPKDRLSPSTFYQNETQVKMALVGIYNAIQPNATPAHFFQFVHLPKSCATSLHAGMPIITQGCIRWVFSEN